METDRNLLVGVVAIQNNFINTSQFAEACAASAERPDEPLTQMLTRRGWITAEQKNEVDALVDRTVKEHVGDVRRAIDSLADAKTREAIREVEEKVHRGTVAYVEPAKAEATSKTVDWKPDTQSRYVLTRVHGKGGLGQVWLATDQHLHREIALKEILPDREQNQETLKRLVKEAQITGQLEHPNIVPVYELGKWPDSDRPFYTMRFLRGQTLSARIRDYHQRRLAGNADPLDLPQLLNAFVSICHALGYAHSRGIVHRDLKPENVMVGDFGEVIVLDWGLAKHVGQPDDEVDQRQVDVSEEASTEATREGKVVGSPAYMAPEQADGQISLLDSLTDIYGLGAILFSILAGRPPHKRTQAGHSFRDTMQLLKQISSGPTPEPRAIESSVPKALNAICAKAMAKRRSQRYSKASELAQEVQRWLADEPVSAHQEPWREQALRWMRRHRTGTQAAAIALILVSIVSTLATVVVNQARRDVEVALGAEQKALEKSEQSLAAEREAKAEATRRFKEARETVDKSLTGVSGVLQYFPGVEPIRTELLEKAAEDYERFAQEKSDDLELRAESGRALIRLGDVRQLLTEFDAAKQAYGSADVLFSELARVAPENPDFQLELAHSRTRLGVLLSTVGPHDQAMLSFDAAIAVVDNLIVHFPKALDYRHERAAILVNRAILLRKTSQLEKALKILEEAESEFKELSDEDHEPKNLEQNVEALAKTRSDLGQVLNLVGRNEEAALKIREAVSAFRELVARRPDHPPHLEGLASSRVNLANTLRLLGRNDQVVEAYTTSVADFEDLLKIRPGVPQYREGVALSRTDLAQVLHLAGRNAEARAEMMRSLEEFIELVNSHPEVHRYHEENAICRGTFGLILRDLNEDQLAEKAFQDSIRIFDELASAVPDVPSYRRGLAVSMTSLARLLHKTGKHDDSKAMFLRGIAEFQKVIEAGLDDPYSQDPLAWCYTHFGDLLRQTGQRQEATIYYAKALTLREQLTKDPEQLHNLSWFLANCGDPQFRDPMRAVQVAEQTKRRVPDNANYWSGLGMAYYRAEKWEDSLKALRVAQELRGKFENSFDWFWLAMAHWKQGDQVQARTSFDRAQRIMEISRPGNLELIRLRAEAAELLGLPTPVSPGKATSEQ